MNRSSLPLEALRSLPTAISIAGSAPVAIYRGTPVEIVRAMASEMEPSDLSVAEAIDALILGLARRWGVVLALPEGCGEDLLAGLFVYALLDTGIGREVPLA